ncbi:MAG: asparagine synthase-related protein [Actinomycetes bacterium]
MAGQTTSSTGSLPRPFEFDRSTLQQFLAFGFVPRADVEDPLSLLSAWSRKPVRQARKVSSSGLLREGVAALRAAVEESAAAGGGGQHVVFLSGGLDSRTILGGLLRLFGRSEVVAATFGLPGEQDYDLAAMVARRAGVRHERLESFSVEWTTDGLVDSVLARQVPLPSAFGQRYLSFLLHRRLGSENVFWDGLCGDVLAGKRTRTDVQEWTWQSAGEQFLVVNLHPEWRRVVSPDFDPHASLPPSPFCPVEQMAYLDQLGLGLRQRCYVGTRLLRDYPTRTPFLTGPWLDFMLSLPWEYRLEQRMYREIQRTAFPELFSLPTTALSGGALTQTRLTRARRRLGGRARQAMGRAGLRRPAARPAQRANDGIRASCRERGPLRELVRENVADLAGRGLLDWLDVDAYVPAAAAGPDADDWLTRRLLNLELNLKAADRRG